MISFSQLFRYHIVDKDQDGEGSTYEGSGSGSDDARYP